MMNLTSIISTIRAILFNERGSVGFMDGAATGGNDGGGADSANGAGGSNSQVSSKGQQPPADSGTGAANQSQQTIHFPDGLDDELKQSKIFEPFVNSEGSINYAELMKSYANTKRLVGKDKVVIPGQDGSQDEWREVFKKLGLPEREEYKVNADENIDADMINGLVDKAHEVGILPNQLQTVVDYINEQNGTQTKQMQEQMQQQFQYQVEGLKQEWGEGFEKNVAKADAALKHFADEQTIEQLSKSGVLNDVNLTKLFAKIGEGLQEDNTFHDEARSDFGMTPDEAKSQLNQFYDKNTHLGQAFMNKSHPDNKMAKEKFMKIMNLLHGTAPAGKTDVRA